MGKATTLILGGLAVAGIALGSTGVVLAYLNQPRKQVEGQLEQADLTEIAGTTIDPNAGDIAVQLKHALAEGNTDVRWFCGKAGTAHPYEGTWDQLGGAVAFNPGQQRLVALRMTFLLDSFTGAGKEHAAPGALTNKIRTSWFDTENHPVATFTVTSTTPKAQADQGDDDIAASGIEGWTHLVVGKFELNGVAKGLAIPARLAISEQSFSLDAELSINRRDYNIDGDAAGSIVDDEVKITVAIAATTGADALTAKLASQINDQSETISSQRLRLTQLEAEVAYLRDQHALASPRLNTLWHSAGLNTAADDLPAMFTDVVPYEKGARPSFEMVLVPGDASKGIEPYYMAKTEVTWEMFYAWAYSTDISPNRSAILQVIGLRPSPLYGGSGQVANGLDNPQRPAMGMSRTTAQAYCLWLSERTGRTYRLPTEQEWEHAVHLGGVPEEPDQFLKHACFRESAYPEPDPFDPFYDPSKPIKIDPDQPLVTRLAGKTLPNALGIHDLIGNAAEWVIPTDPAVRKVRGGHFMMPVADYTPDWEAAEDQDIWNASYPQKPVSRFWYKDVYFAGFRLVCEPVNVPGGE